MAIARAVETPDAPGLWSMRARGGNLRGNGPGLHAVPEDFPHPQDIVGVALKSLIMLEALRYMTFPSA